MATRDAAESQLRHYDERTREKTGIGLFHWLTFASIGASVGLFLAGKREWGLLVGLWPPTIQALRSK